MTPRQQAQEYMDNKYSTNLSSKFKYTVQVNHGDGSVFIFQNAYTELKKFGELKDVEMLLVYTEHCGYYNFYIEDLEFWRKTKWVK
jgi:hypothetical protein